MKKAYLIAGIALGILLILAFTSRHELSKLDLTQVPDRAVWQLSDRVVQSLGLEPGDRVADIGAGDGYFVFRLADAVGPEGRVFAVEVEEEKVRELEEAVRRKGYSNVEVVLGELGDPLLPDRAIDVVFLCNTYHHIDDRIVYFSRLSADLRPGGRVAIVDMRAVLGGFSRLFTVPGHSTPRQTIYDEMEAAGYRSSESFEFLPVQNFEILSRGSP